MLFTYSRFSQLFLLLLFPAFLFAQTNVEGLVLDENTEPLGFAGVMLLNPTDSSLVRGDITDEAGRFHLSITTPGAYLIGVSMVGYEDFFSDVFTVASDQSLDLGSISLAAGIATLDEVEITARKPLFEQRIDRLVVNVENSVASAGATALEVLERSPGVIVNRQSNDISLAGKSGVILMINNKVNRMPMEALIQMLEGMPADNISRIELITTPPASFDAEGNAGIISIVLKKNLDEGLNGSASLTAGYGVNEKYGGNGNFNYRRGQVNIFGDYGYFNDHSAQTFTNYRAITLNNVLTENDNVSVRDPYTETQSARLGIDLNVGSNTVIGLLGTWGRRNWTMDAVNTVQLFENGNLQEELIITNDELNLWNSYLANFNVQHQFEQGARLTFDVDYAYYKNDNPTNYLNEYYNAEGQPTASGQLRNDKDTPIAIWVAKADFTKELAEGLTFEAGAKGAISQFDNDFSVENLVQGEWVSDGQYTNSYRLDESIGAAYSAVSWQVTPKTGIKAGLRYEYTNSKLGSLTQADIVDREYGNFFPSLFLTQQVGEEQEVQLSYSRRIERPAYTQLAPFVIFLDPNTLLSGNVALQPSFTDAYRAGYRYKTWFFATEYSFTEDAIAGWQPTIDAETNQQVNSSINQDNQRFFSGSVSFPVTVTPWWSMRTNLVAFHIQNEATIEGLTVTNEQTTFRANTTQSFTLPWKLSLEVDAFYMSPVAWGLLTSEPRYDLNVGLQKAFRDGSNLRVNMTNILLQGNWVSSVSEPDLNLNYRGAYLFQERQVRVTYSRKFGRSQIKGARQRATGSEAERSRVQQN